MQPPKAADASDAEPRPEGSGTPDTPGTGKAEGTREASGGPRSSGAPGGPKPPGKHLTGSTLASSAAAAEHVSGDEPLLPARVHRPSDLMRLFIGVAAVVLLLAVAAFAQNTTTGLENDISKGTDQAPDLLIKIAGLVSSIAVLLVPVAFAIERLVK
ncbi:TIGR00374 family protein, partial [Streptomyces albidoflavus]